MTGETDAARRVTTPGELAVILCTLGVAIALIVYLSAQRQPQLRASPAGFDGLAVWLADGGMDAQSFTGGWQIDTAEISLNILPLYDSDLRRTRERATSREEVIFQQDELDLSAPTLREKARMAPSLIVLPKWRSGMRLTGEAHPVLLIEEQRVSAVLHDISGVQAGRIRHVASPSTTARYTATDGRTLTAVLYAAQVIAGNACEPLIGTADAMVLGSCPLIKGAGGARVLILSDPDLFNNHGLRLGDNAAIARDLIGAAAGGGRVLIDYSRRNWLTGDSEAPARERSWADLARFFGYPFSILWASAALFMAVLLWRAARRFGPVRDAPDTVSAGKRTTLAARARLFRLTGQDGALLSDYASARLSAVASAIVGPRHSRPGSDTEVVLRFAARRDPALAAALDTTLGRIRALPPAISASDAMAQIDALETLLERLSDDT